MKTVKNAVISATLLCAISLGTNAQSNTQMLFHNLGITEQDYRIPAIVMNKDGHLIALADRRYTNLGHDVGAGEIDIQSRISKDNGSTWDGNDTNPRTIIDGIGGEGFDCAHGDAAVVCDRETGRILLLCASGSVGFPAGGTNIGRYYSDDGGLTFHGEEMTEGIPEEVRTKKFFSSGRICQSSRIKHGSHYRIYSGMCTATGSQVLFSDDFGTTWNLLGGVIKDGNECKVEELPDGSVLLSCRISGRTGRMFCVFRYDNSQHNSGSWTEVITSTDMTAASCNGEVLLVETANKDTYVLLQSVPNSDKRENVSIYWKLIHKDDPFTTSTFYDKWDGCNKVSTTSSAYSTMVTDMNGNIAFIWEENNIWRDYVESYDIMFTTLPLSIITQKTVTTE